MSKLTMRQFVKNVAKRNDVKLKSYQYIAIGRKKTAHIADDIAQSIYKNVKMPITPDKVMNALYASQPNEFIIFNNQ